MDEITAAVPFEGGIYVFTRLGKVFLFWREPNNGQVHIDLLATFPIL